MQYKQILDTKSKTKGKNTCEYIILHHTGTKENTITGNINHLTTSGKASTHYIVDTNGDVYKIGQDTDIMWHAGTSQWKQTKDLNNHSIGIETIGPLSDGGFTDAQRESIATLIKELCKTHDIQKENVLRHADITSDTGAQGILWDGKSKARKVDIASTFWSNKFKSFDEYRASLFVVAPVIPETEKLMPIAELRAIWENTTKRSFNDYTIDSRTKYLIDISMNKTPFVPVNIPDAVIDPVVSPYIFNGWGYQAELYKEYIPLLPENPFKTVLEYDQKKDPSCVIFSGAGMITYNTGLTFTNDELREVWEEYQGNKGGYPYKTTTQMGQRFHLGHFPIDAKSKEFDDVLDKGWGIQLSIRTDAQFYIDAVDNGIVEKVHKLPVLGEDVYRHAIFMYKKDGKVFLQNSWKNGTNINIYDVTNVYKPMIANALIQQCAMICVPYNIEKGLGMKYTLKSFSRALVRGGITATGDLWEKMKKGPAKIDGKIDKEYYIK